MKHFRNHYNKMNPTLKGYLQLTRPANLPTAAADILAGVAIAGVIGTTSLPILIDCNITIHIFLLVLASVFLYAGGVVLNDVFDHKLDTLERPERPIPSAVVTLNNAGIFGGILLFMGVVLAFTVNYYSGIIAIFLAISIFIYDAFSKKYVTLGPFNMGLCRGLNLLLGISVLGGFSYWWLAVIPMVYIFAITLISRGEVHGKNKNHIVLAALLYAVVIFTVVYINSIGSDTIFQAIPFLLIFIYMIYHPLLRAYRNNSPENIKKAVMGGVISIILLDALLAVTFSNWWYACLLLLLLPLSIFLSKSFAVT